MVVFALIVVIQIIDNRSTISSSAPLLLSSLLCSLLLFSSLPIHLSPLLLSSSAHRRREDIKKGRHKDFGAGQDKAVARRSIE